VTKEASNAYQALWSNVDGVADAWAAMWAKVASRFGRKPSVLGLELINEPFAGDLYHDPLIMAPYPNPHNADRTNLQPAYDRINAAVRAVDKDVLLFFGGVTWDDLGAGFSAVPGGKEFANRSVLAFHYYEPPQKSTSLQFGAQAGAARRLGCAAFLTETESPGPHKATPGHFEWPGGVGDGADSALQHWVGWEWKTFFRRASDATNISQLDEWGAGKTGSGRAEFFTPAGPVQLFQSANARTYARAVAGHAVSMFFNVTSSDFELQYDIVDGAPTAPTEIYLWPERYPNGADVSASASRGAVHVDFDGRSRVLVHPAAGLERGSRVVVTIRNKPAAGDGLQVFV